MFHQLLAPIFAVALLLTIADMQAYGQSSGAQNDPSVDQKTLAFVAPAAAAFIDTPLTEVDEMPLFPGGVDSLFQFIGKNLEYPSAARENGVEGTVYIRFVIGVDGKVRNAEVLRSPDASLSEESIRVISLMPSWTPGRNRGAEVPVYYTLPIRYSLNARQRGK